MKNHNVNYSMKLDNISYKIDDKVILNNLNLDLLKGEFLILLGANGCGKSTLMNIISSNIKNYKGCINFHDNFVLAKSLKIMTQNSFDSLFVDLSVYDNYRILNHKLHNRKAMTRDDFMSYIGQFNINLSQKLDTVVSVLSGGERQALVLALLTCYQPELLLLDEHTSALDPVAANNIMQLTNKIVRQNNISCILTTHDLEIAQEYGDKILVLGTNSTYQIIDSESKKQLTIDYMKQNFY